ncbi:MAG: LysR family transcriptional regulator [Acholeplasmatales bacterium]|jgi:DNA-binding transcriptional LysR family regulator|nr:LysR family transcriptional regulator [Acholeplasmataceae bacterium]MDY0115593.1 LysR family transcriptional regulator [Acholeplasmatales bacterium]MCK9289205.1 LysR family transcriptional regulator [Acholeplasmataceae bacterium]MCK9427689.1 LysR family transcriptional regulator [Acholeplasmataceae bacterium]MDD4090235.1 LysR family transcriptional regulator [Acholeplasmataceae bacterium]
MLKERLKTLITLNEEKNYTKTAKILNISQPAVSQHIIALENEYRVVIFKRKGKILKTTEEGEILIKNAKRLLAIDKNITKELLLTKSQLRKLDIGITLTASGYFIPELLNVFKEKFPEIRYNFHTDLAENIYERLKYYELDFAIVDGKPLNNNLECDLLLYDELVLIANPNNPLKAKKEITIEEIKEEKFILRHKNANTRIVFEKFLGKQQLNTDDLDVILEIDNTALIKQLIIDGYGISVISKMLCEEELKNETLIVLPLKDFSLKRGIFLIYLKENIDDYVIKNIKDLITFKKGVKENGN